MIVSSVCGIHCFLSMQVLGTAYPRTPSNLWFAIEFMQAFVKSVYAGIDFAGVSFEGDRPDLIVHVPDGGLDIQDQPLHWTLPCGRTD